LPDLERQALAHRQAVQGPLAQVREAKSRLDLLHRERIPDLTLAAVYKHEELADVFGGRVSIPLPFFRRNQGAIVEQQARIDQSEATASQAELRVRLEVRTTYQAWQRALAVSAQIPAEMEARLSADVEALRNAYGRGAMPLIGVLASLRETFAARRTLVDAKTDALVASFELARATASPIALVSGGGRP
jgi:cobalt-zinc-cadmium efflux system outer membrane protein